MGKCITLCDSSTISKVSAVEPILIVIWVVGIFLLERSGECDMCQALFSKSNIWVSNVQFLMRHGGLYVNRALLKCRQVEQLKDYFRSLANLFTGKLQVPCDPGQGPRVNTFDEASEDSVL